MNKDRILQQAARLAEQAMNGGPTPQPTKIPIQPVPMSIGMAQVQMPDGTMGVALMIATPVGESTYFFDADQAKKVAEALQKTASASSSGLVVPA